METLHTALKRKARAILHSIGAPYTIGTTSPRNDYPLYIEFWYRLGSPAQAGQRKRTPGILQFTLYAVSESYESDASRAAEIIHTTFSERRWYVWTNDYLETEELRITTLPGLKAGKQVVVVDGGFDYFGAVPLIN